MHIPAILIWENDPDQLSKLCVAAQTAGIGVEIIVANGATAKEYLRKGSIPSQANPNELIRIGSALINAEYLSPLEAWNFVAQDLRILLYTSDSISTEVQKTVEMDFFLLEFLLERNVEHCFGSSDLLDLISQLSREEFSEPFKHSELLAEGVYIAPQASSEYGPTDVSRKSYLSTFGKYELETAAEEYVRISLKFGQWVGITRSAFKGHLLEPVGSISNYLYEFGFLQLSTRGWIQSKWSEAGERVYFPRPSFLTTILTAPEY